MPDLQDLEARTRELLKQAAVARPMRAGWVGERWMKCGKPGCPCRTDPARRHGPYVTLTTPGPGRTRTRYLTAEAASVVRRQIDAAREFRAAIREALRTAERWADAELAETEAASPEAAEKGGSARRSKRRSPGRSTR